MKHLLSIESLTPSELETLLDLADAAKAARREGRQTQLEGQTWALIFCKSSTRTRVSFEVGIRELGGNVMFLSSSDIQLGRGEPIRDTARVLGRMVHGAVIRTFAQQDVEEFAAFAKIPTINALTDDEHPCQIVADLQTIRERRGSLNELTVTFAGDGACNVARSWIFAAAHLGFQLRIAAPKDYQPASETIPADLVKSGKLVVTDDLATAVEGADVVYTDVWVSMGKEDEAGDRLETLRPFQVDADVLKQAKSGVLVMHCLPAYRGKEITEEVLEAHADTIFTQAENRLHAQKGILTWLAKHSTDG